MDSRKPLNKFLISAILIGIAFHGTAIFFTLENTYDALIHLFFAEHYANSWFEPWNYKWYTGFSVMSYPPLVHQTIGLLSLIGGLKFGMFTVAIIAIVLFTTGVYRYSLLLTSNRVVAGYATVLCIFSSSFIETLHLFGQLPSIVGISVLMHAQPEIYLWLKTGRYRYLFTSLSLIAVTVTSHHVTPIFGMIFFIFPLIGLVIMDVSKERVGTMKAVTFNVFLKSFFKLFKRIISFGMLSLVIIIGCILPYWINSKNNPITQVPIPHGSRDNFIEITSSGLMFFLIPWGVLLILIPYFLYRYYSKRYLFFGLSITILIVLGTGGTTPIPRIVLGETAFNILTLDRFTLWASIMSLPLFGEFVYRFVEGDLKTRIVSRFGSIYYRIIGAILAGLFLFMAVFSVSLGYFRPLQPQRINMLPIINFMNQDQHDNWRYLTLGFGDQMAWLSAQTGALSVDGNYHSARRLPELTTRPIERLENCKFKGVAGIGSLQQFLTTPEKYNLKYIFSNDKFYDPILYFCGWQRLQQLENGNLVWEKLNVAPLSTILPKDDIPTWQKLMWGIIPLLTVTIAFMLNIQMLWVRSIKGIIKTKPDYLNYEINFTNFPRNLLRITHVWSFILACVVFFSGYLLYIKNSTQISPENAVVAYYDALDFKNFEIAYGLINPKENLSISQYLLEISVADGLLSSYAKLDAIKTTVTSRLDTIATVKVETEWITPLEKLSKVEYKTLVKHKNKWFLNPTDLDNDLPPNQLYTSNSTNYFNHGRRRTSTEESFHEDVLKQPVLEILSAKLVKKGNSYSIIGELQNIDNVPADVVLKGTLYSEENELLATFNAKYVVKHKLLPKEVTSFKINFEGIAWSRTQDSIPETFNPDEFTPIDFKKPPSKFDLQIAGNVSGSDLYKKLAISQLEINKKGIQGTLFNGGIEEVTIPQVLVSYYDEQKGLLWVDHMFLKEGIRQERKRAFEYSFSSSDSLSIINDDMSNCYVNGLPNGTITTSPNDATKNEKTEMILQPINFEKYHFIKTEVNTYIGNPN